MGSKTQDALLAALREIRFRAESTEANDSAAALGGLSDREKIIRQSVIPSGTWVSGYGPIPGLSIRTYWALAAAGLIEHVFDGYWRAKGGA